MVDVLSVQVWIWNMKPAEEGWWGKPFKKGRGERENNGGDEPNWDMYICIYEYVTLKPCTTIIY
jgi:hypothetical protein